MDQSPLGNVLGHLAQMAERQGQLHQTQNEALMDLAQSLAADRAMIRELLAAGGRGEGPRGAGPATSIHVPKMGEADDAEAFIETFQGVAEQLMDQARRWLVPGRNTAEEVVEQVAMESEPATTDTKPTYQCGCPTAGSTNPGAEGEMGGRSRAGA
ncbi:unnamed protein product [Boreogadus saida]